MRVSPLVRCRTPLVLPFLALAACAESATAPTARPEISELTADLSASSANPKPKKLKARETYDKVGKITVYRFVIDPAAAYELELGDHTVVLPARVICDPATSSYGAGEWDKPCSLARTPLTFQAFVGTRHGHAAIDFEPNVRFAPGSDDNPGRWVVLTLKDSKKVAEGKEYSILWWDADAAGDNGLTRGAWVDEAATDPTLRAWTDAHGNKVSRRLKHLSGYNVTSGRSEER